MMTRSLRQWTPIVFCLLTAAAAQVLPAFAQDGTPSPSVPDIFLSARFQGSEPAHVLVVEKASQTLSLYRLDDMPVKIMDMPCSTGKSPGPKHVEGDSKTPEGVYFFIKRHETDELAPIYGIRAFPTDYPNLMDRIAQRSGNAIWLHGTNKPLLPTDSSGCIVLENQNIEKITSYIRLHRMPMVIVEQLQFVPWAEQQERAKPILKLIQDWTATMKTGSYHDYVALYGDDFVPDISWWSKWLTLLKQANASKNPISVDARPLFLFNHNGTMTALFDQTLTDGPHQEYVGLKKLYIADINGSPRIVVEDYQHLPEKAEEMAPLLLAETRIRSKAETLLAQKTPPPAPATRPASAPASPAAPASVDGVKKLVDDWMKAWSDKNADRYGSFYAQDFKSQGMDKPAWLAYKKQLNRKYSFIRVNQRDLKVQSQGEQLLVSFIQVYESNAFKTQGRKQLILKRENDAWKIHRETIQKF